MLFVLGFGLFAEARSLTCWHEQKVQGRFNKNQFVVKEYLLRLDDDHGELTIGAYDGVLKSCKLTDKREEYDYYYGEYVALKSFCDDGRVFLSAANVASDLEGSRFRGRAVLRKKDQVLVKTIVCDER